MHVMTTETYVALDGTEFDNEEACAEYEKEIIEEEILPEIKMFDTYGTELKGINSDNLQELTLIFISTGRTAEMFNTLLHEMYEMYWNSEFEQPGAYEWVEEENRFCNVKSLLEEAENKVNDLENIMCDYYTFLDESNEF